MIDRVDFGLQRPSSKNLRIFVTMTQQDLDLVPRLATALSNGAAKTLVEAKEARSQRSRCSPCLKNPTHNQGAQ